MYNKVRTMGGWRVSSRENILADIYSPEHADLFIEALKKRDAENWKKDIPWEVINDGIKWVGMDEDGDWCGYSDKPALRAGLFFADAQCLSWNLNGVKMPTPPDWKRSLVKRPEGK